MANEKSAKLIDFNGTQKELKDITEIAQMTSEILKHEHNIVISMHEAIPTIVYEFLYCCAQFLEKNKSTDTDVSLNLMNMIEMGVTYRESDSGEKTGNFTPYVQSGTILKTVIKSDEMTEDEE